MDFLEDKIISRKISITKLGEVLVEDGIKKGKELLELSSSFVISNVVQISNQNSNKFTTILQLFCNLCKSLLYNVDIKHNKKNNKSAC